MEGSSPYIGESSKVRSMLDLFNLTKILSMVIGILGFLLAAWSAWPIIYGGWAGIFGAIYWIAAAIINLMFYMKIDEFVNMVKSRKYKELQDFILIWLVLTLIFGVIVGILLLIVYLELNEIKGSIAYAQENPPVAPPPPPS